MKHQIKKIIAIILIATIIYIPIYQTKKAYGFIALAPYVPYVATIMVAAGLTFVTQEDYTSAVNDWWDQQSQTVRNYAVMGAAGAVVGIGVIENALWDSIRGYTKNNYTTGNNTKEYGTQEVPLDEYAEATPANNEVTQMNLSGSNYSYKVVGSSIQLYVNGVYTSTKSNGTYDKVSATGMFYKQDNGFLYVYFTGKNDDGFTRDSYVIWARNVNMSIESVLKGGIQYYVTGQAGVDTNELDFPVDLDGPGYRWWLEDDGTMHLEPINTTVGGEPGSPTPKRLIGFPIGGFDEDGDGQTDPGKELYPLEKAKPDTVVCPWDVILEAGPQPDGTTTTEPTIIPEGSPLPVTQTPDPIYTHDPTPIPDQTTTTPDPTVNPDDWTIPTDKTTTDGTPDGTETTKLPDGLIDILTDTTLDPDTGERTQNTINFDPLKFVGSQLTWKFPFSLPWDLLRSIQAITTSSEMPEILYTFTIPGLRDTELKINFDMWNDVATAVRGIEAFIFPLGLVFATRKLMGGAV